MDNVLEKVKPRKLEVIISEEAWQSLEAAVAELNYIQSVMKYTPRLLVEQVVEENSNNDELINSALIRIDCFIQKQREELRAKRLSLKNKDK